MAATRKRNTRKTASNIEATPRHVWLAYLGLFVAARREGRAAISRAVAKAEATSNDMRKATRQAEKELRGRVDELRSQVQPKVMQFSGDVEARLAPVLDKLGLKPKARRAPRKGRKPAAKQAAGRRTTRKPAKRVAKKTAQ